MASTFSSWETDPFFAAAEDVQQSADRMEAAYRNWIYKRALAEETPAAETNINLCNEDVALALGTTKWQLEEFAKAITKSDNFLRGEDVSKRYFSFIEAIQNQIFLIEEALCGCIDAQFPKSFRSAKLDADERDQLEMFLSGGACGRVPDFLAHGAKQHGSSLASSKTLVPISNAKGSAASRIMCNNHDSQGFCASSGSNECVNDAQDHNETIEAGRVPQQELIEKRILQGNKDTTGHTSLVCSDNAVGDSFTKLHRLKKPPSCRNDFKSWKSGSLCIKAKEDATLCCRKDKLQPDIEWGHVPEDARSHKQNSLQRAGRQKVRQLLGLRYSPACNSSGRRASFVVILFCLGCMYFWFLSTLVPYINSMFPHS